MLIDMAKFLFRNLEPLILLPAMNKEAHFLPPSQLGVFDL